MHHDTAGLGDLEPDGAAQTGEAAGGDQRVQQHQQARRRRAERQHVVAAHTRGRAEHTGQRVGDAVLRAQRQLDPAVAELGQRCAQLGLPGPHAPAALDDHELVLVGQPRDPDLAAEGVRSRRHDVLKGRWDVAGDALHDGAHGRQHLQLVSQPLGGGDRTDQADRGGRRGPEVVVGRERFR